MRIQAGNRVFIKDMALYLIPPSSPATIAPSVSSPKEPGNPTVLPLHILRNFHFTFLIRHPRHSIPSLYRCTCPPLSAQTGFTYFLSEEAGYRELRMLVEFLLKKGVVTREGISVLDAGDLLDNPEGAVRRYCERVGLEFRQEMLKWKNGGCEEFEKWKGFHEDVIGSVGLFRAVGFFSWRGWRYAFTDDVGDRGRKRPLRWRCRNGPRSGGWRRQRS